MKTFLQTTVYPWAGADGLYFRGYLMTEDACLRGREAIAYIKAHWVPDETAGFLEELNGIFSLIWDRGDEILMAVDRLRSLPLFYAVVDGILWVGHDADTLARALPEITIDQLSQEDYLSSDIFVSGPHTLISQLQPVQAGEFCVFQPGTATLTRQSYFHMEHGDFFDSNDLETMKTEFWAVYERTGKSLVRALGGRTAVLPLSGGADSRMVATLLKKAGYEKVICFSYGTPGNRESEISRQVAASFGYPWHMVPYTNETWAHLLDSQEMEDYERMSFSFSSTPHLQDFAAVKYLKEHGILPSDSVFVPGHSGDLLAGSHLTPDFLSGTMSKQAFYQAFYKKFYPRGGLSPALRSRLESYGLWEESGNTERLASNMEWFNTQNRQGKFIVNSVRVYEFFGYEWLIPLWDNDQFAFWRRVPMSWRYQRKLYFLTVDNALPSTNDVTAITRLATLARKIPPVRHLLRTGKQVKQYWRSPLRMERLFPLGLYLKMALRGYPNFAPQTLISRRLVNKTMDFCTKRRYS